MESTGSPHDASHVASPGAATSKAGDGLPRFAVVDIETSGLSTRRHRILQVAVVTVDAGDVVDEWTSLIRLRWPWPINRVGPRRVHGIARKTLRGAPAQHDVIRELADRLHGSVFTAHNVRFDWPFIERAASQAEIDIVPAARLCTLRMSRSLDPERVRSHRLADVCERYGISNARPHDALHDARATANALPHLLAEHGITGADDLQRLYERW